MNVQNSVVPALERALNIIEYIAAHNEPVTLKQITSDLHIPSASAFRLIKIWSLADMFLKIQMAI